jgi:hypothetical protein
MEERTMNTTPETDWTCTRCIEEPCPIIPGDTIHAVDCPTLGTPEQFTGGESKEQAADIAEAKEALLTKAHVLLVAYSQTGRVTE